MSTQNTTFPFNYLIPEVIRTAWTFQTIFKFDSLLWVFGWAPSPSLLLDEWLGLCQGH